MAGKTTKRRSLVARLRKLEVQGAAIPSPKKRKASAALKKALPDADEIARKAASEAMYSCGWRTVPAKARVGIYYRKPEVEKIRDWLEAELHNAYLKALALAHGVKG